MRADTLILGGAAGFLLARWLMSRQAAPARAVSAELAAAAASGAPTFVVDQGVPVAPVDAGGSGMPGGTLPPMAKGQGDMSTWMMRPDAITLARKTYLPKNILTKSGGQAVPFGPYDPSSKHPIQTATSGLSGVFGEPVIGPPTIPMWTAGTITPRFARLPGPPHFPGASTNWY